MKAKTLAVLSIAALAMAGAAGAGPKQVAAPAAQLSSAEPRSRDKPLANNGEPFQLICRGGADLKVDQSWWVIPRGDPRFVPCQPDYLGGCATELYRWSITFRRSSLRPDHTGRNLKPGECGPADFPWRAIDETAIQTRVGSDGSLPGIQLYPWERGEADVPVYEWMRTQKLLEFLKSPANYWSFDVQNTVGRVYYPTQESDFVEGDYFHVLSSQYWKPEFYRGPTVTTVESIKSNPVKSYGVGGQPVTASPAPITAADLDALSARGEPIANQDPLAAELRSRMPEGPALRGFDIGMAAAEGNTAPGPGKQRIHDALNPAEQGGYDVAVSFSLQRNKNAQFAATGAAIALTDPDVAQARTADGDVFYWLGFDIATGIFGDPNLGALGNTATGPGSQGIRDALNSAAQRGFNASVAMHLGRNYRR